MRRNMYMLRFFQHKPTPYSREGRGRFMLEHKNKEQIGLIVRVKETQEKKNKRNGTK